MAAFWLVNTNDTHLAIANQYMIDNEYIWARHDTKDA